MHEASYDEVYDYTGISFPSCLQNYCALFDQATPIYFYTNKILYSRAFQPYITLIGLYKKKWRNK